jgi:hypothetical protein
MLDTGQTEFAPVRSSNTHPIEMLDAMETGEQGEYTP